MQETNTAWTLLCACHCAIPLTCAMSLNLQPATLWSRHSNGNENLRVEFAHDQRFKPTPDNPKLGFIFPTGHLLWRNQPCRIDEKDEDGDEEGGVKIAGRKARRNCIHCPVSPWSGIEASRDLAKLGWTGVGDAVKEGCLLSQTKLLPQQEGWPLAINHSGLNGQRQSTFEGTASKELNCTRQSLPFPQ